MIFQHTTLEAPRTPVIQHGLNKKIRNNIQTIRQTPRKAKYDRRPPTAGEPVIISNLTQP